LVDADKVDAVKSGLAAGSLFLVLLHIAILFPLYLS
jgi:hypothetical protein